MTKNASPSAVIRRRWQAPAIVRVMADLAEAGPNPNAREGSFAMGS